MYFRLIFFLIICFVGLRLNAQSGCSNYLEQAKAEMKIGKFNEAISILKNCVSTDTSNVHHWQTHRLLALCYLELDSVAHAETEVINLLMRNPLYKSSIIEDSKKLRVLMDGVNRIPKYSLSMFVSGNRSNPLVTQSYAVTPAEKDYGGFSEQKTGFGLGLQGGYGISEHISIQLGISLLESKYHLKYEIPDFISNHEDFTSKSDIVRIHYNEQLRYIQFPVMARIRIYANKKMNVYGQAGHVFGGLIKSNYSISLYNERTGSEHLPLLNIENKSVRKPFNHSSAFGMGIGAKLFEGNVFAEIGYQKAWNKLNRPSERLHNPELIKEYFYVDDDLILNRFVCSVGYSFFFNYKIKR